MDPVPPRSLGPELTIRNGADAHALLAALLGGRGPVTLDGGAIERIDTAGLQLLGAFIQALGASGRTIAWHAASPTLKGAAQALGLGGTLRLEDPR